MSYRPAARALVVVGAALALDACARGRTDERTTDVPISGMSPRVDPDPVLDGAVDEYGDPIKPTPDVPEVMRDAGSTAPRDVGVTPPVDVAACGTAGRACCAGSNCLNNLRCAAGVCAEASPCGAWQQACCGVGACGPGLTCGGGSCAAATLCGASGQVCCSGATPCLARQVCVSASCRPCGAAGQPCCTTLAPTCNTGLRCASSLCTSG